MGPSPIPHPSELSSTTCYFTYLPSSSHFSIETPHSPLSAYTPDISSDTHNPLLAVRCLPHPTAPVMDASKLLQLQTAAAYDVRPNSRPVQQPLPALSSTTPASSSSSASSASSASSSSSISSGTPPLPTWWCTRCRRSSTGGSGMVQFGTNLYYCSHCASITGYTAGG